LPEHPFAPFLGGMLGSAAVGREVSPRSKATASPRRRGNPYHLEANVLLVFVKGVVIGLFIAAPVGPIAMLCISRTLSEGAFSGLATGLGAAMADATYGVVAAFGITAISTVLIEHESLLKLVGGMLLCAMGLKVALLPSSMRTPDSVQKAMSRHGSLLVDFSTTFVLTVANPVTLIAFAAAFAGLGQSDLVTIAHSGMLVLGVFSGSGFWWLCLTFSAGRIRNWLNPRILRIANRAVGVLLALFGIVVLGSLAL
jgi:threonine/homoserine/homoserine lactone efflux protein